MRRLFSKDLAQAAPRVALGAVLFWLWLMAAEAFVGEDLPARNLDLLSWGSLVTLLQSLLLIAMLDLIQLTRGIRSWSGAAFAGVVLASFSIMALRASAQRSRVAVVFLGIVLSSLLLYAVRVRRRDGARRP
jgi:hypothetical protein